MLAASSFLSRTSWLIGLVGYLGASAAAAAATTITTMMEVHRDGGGANRGKGTARGTR